jgi:cyanocobalamin reductase (cyanide-eliminating) / alkylcobalamin dealkylase
MFHPFQTKWYNDSITDAPTSTIDLCKLELSHATTTTTITSTTAFLIGNTKHMLSYFVRAHQQRIMIISKMNDDDEYSKNPLDTYVKESIEETVSKYFQCCCQSSKYRIYWESCYDIDNLVSMQRVAVVSGLSYFDNESMLCVHPIYGTWHSFRAIIVIDDESEFDIPQSPPVPLRCCLSVNEITKAAAAMKYASSLVLPIQTQKDKNNDTHHPTNEILNNTIVDAWIKVRDCIELGRDQYRYGTHQRLYHYTKDSKYIQMD